MKKCVLLFLFLVNINFLKAQQYHQNQPFDTTIYSGHYRLENLCTNALDPHIEIDTSLYSYVNGMSFMIIIDSVVFPGPNPVQVGDTILLNSLNPVFSLPPIPGLEFWFRIKLTGTPSVLNQSYPCKIEINLCTCYCLDMSIKYSSLDTSTCFVVISNNINQIMINRNVNIYPNPVSKELTVDSKQFNIKNIEIIDIIGKILKTIKTDLNNINVADLPSGIYFIRLITDERTITNKFVKQ